MPIAAGIGIEGIIWLIILIFWGIAQAVQKSRRGAPGAPPRRTPGPLDDDLREMLEQLAGRTSTPPRQPAPTATSFEDEEIEEELARTAPPPPPVRPRPQPIQRPRQTTRPAHKPAPVRMPPPAIPQFAASEYADLTPKLSAGEIAADLSVRSGLNAPGLSMRMKGMSLQGMATMPTGNLSRRHGQPVLNPADLRNPESLRKAMLAKMILDAPRGLVPYGAPPA